MTGSQCGLWQHIWTQILCLPMGSLQVRRHRGCMVKTKPKPCVSQTSPCNYTEIEADLVKTQNFYLPIVFVCLGQHVSCIFQQLPYKYTETEVGLVEAHICCLCYCISCFDGSICTSVVIQCNLLVYVLENAFVLIQPHLDQQEVGPTPFQNQHKYCNPWSRAQLFGWRKYILVDSVRMWYYRGIK